MEDRRSLLGRLVRFDLPIEDSIAMLRAYGWDSQEELVVLSAADAIRILERYLRGELTARQVAYWAELLEMRNDVGLEARWADELRRLIAVLANPESGESLTPTLAIQLRRALLEEAA